MKAHILQHVAFEGPGAAIEAWLAARGAEIGVTAFHEPGAALPALDGLGLVIAMGGPMSVNDEAALPWLRAEKDFLRRAMHAGIPVLGICLGSQLMASALGAEVCRHAVKEIGWFPVMAVPTPAGAFAFPAETTVLHWHGETFDLPAGAVHLAASAACRHQAFQWGERAIGLQCHPEATAETVALLIRHCADELVPAPWVQDGAALSAGAMREAASANALMHRILDYLVRS